MRQDRSEFIRRLQAITNACDRELLVNKNELLHDECARLLRCGLTVMLFSSLEDFIRARIAHAMSYLTPAILPFDSLPSKVREAASDIALRNLATQIQYIPKVDRFQLLVEEFRKLASVGTQTYSVSRYAFAHAKTNIQIDEVLDTLEAFGVEKPPESLHFTARRIGLATPGPLKNEFEQLSRQRHKAAHTQTFDIPNTDLKARVSSALAIGISFDILLCSALGHLQTLAMNRKQMVDLKAADVQILMASARGRSTYALIELDKNPGNPPKRALKVSADLSEIRAEGMRRLRAGTGAFLLRDHTNLPVEWHCRAGEA